MLPTKWLLFLWLSLPVSGYVAGYSVRDEQAKDYVSECGPLHSEGDVVVSRLVNKENVLTLECENHSILKWTNSPNRGEK